ncbi:MAG TPA: manganese efflux pump MntP family protein [Candidatus Bathyarchaeia archaeon]|nr:manganese efflux pump MntP family protein [Candidatus Bathyarchaeia archaeon]
MGWWAVFLIAVGLAMDAFAISIATGIALDRGHVRNALRMGASFGFFQMMMPVLGWSLGRTVVGWVEHIDHWVAFGILVVIGGKMIYEAFQLEKAERAEDRVSWMKLFGLSIATSIDAFAVGIGLAFLKVDIFWPVVVIGVVTFGMSFAGVFIGNHVGHLFEKKIEILGGLILILLGIAILMKHGVCAGVIL